MAGTIAPPRTCVRQEAPPGSTNIRSLPQGLSTIVVTVRSLTDYREMCLRALVGVGLYDPAANFGDHLTRSDGARPRTVAALRQHHST